MPATHAHPPNSTRSFFRSADGREWTLAALRGPIADDFGLTDAERTELLPSGAQSRFVNRLCWSKVHLERAGHPCGLS
jgi:restriction system protein